MEPNYLNHIIVMLRVVIRENKPHSNYLGQKKPSVSTLRQMSPCDEANSWRSSRPFVFAK